MRLRLRLAEYCETVLLALVRLLLPAEGRHRCTAVPPPPVSPHSPPARPHRPARARPLPDTPLVRPCLPTPEEHHARRLVRTAEVSA
ncbi:hypothetical protein [Streptomyces glaucus]|uniref:Secreted protein n=1 Tax=Streptomyces glaucus TaxID=284029 RepID=A0ABN3JKC9_9ACTN